MGRHSYAVALGSNRRHGAHGSPTEVLDAAIAAIGDLGSVEAVSHVIHTAALGPAGRGFANAALLLDSGLDPPQLLAALKALEQSFGRRRGRRWGARVLDLDIILWSGGPWAGPGLIIPHPHMRERLFVLEPLAEIAPDWRDPLTVLTVRQLLYRLRTRRPVDPASTRS